MPIIKTKLKPLDTCCLVQIKVAEEKTEGGIILAESTKKEDTESYDVGILIKRGVNAFQDILDEADRPQIGDKVHFVRYGGRKKSLDDNKDYILRVIQDKDIFAIEEK